MSDLIGLEGVHKLDILQNSINIEQKLEILKIWNTLKVYVIKAHPDRLTPLQAFCKIFKIFNLNKVQNQIQLLTGNVNHYKKSGKVISWINIQKGRSFFR